MEAILETKTVQIGTQTIAYYESGGKGKPILMIHGNSQSGKVFKRQIESSLGEEYHIVAIDLLGHGESTHADDPMSSYNPAAYANVIVEVAKNLELSDGVFVGWSLGGHMLLEASDQLMDAKGFVIFGAPPLGIPPAMTEISLPSPSAEAVLTMQCAFKLKLSDSEIENWAKCMLKPNSTEDIDFFCSNIRKSDGHARESMGASLAQGNYKDEVKIVANLNIPLAIIQGEQEQLVNGDYISKLNIPSLWKGELQIIKDAGHSPHWEEPNIFNALLKEFIEDINK